MDIVEKRNIILLVPEFEPQFVQPISQSYPCSYAVANLH